jgi:hypothetical protein
MTDSRPSFNDWVAGTRADMEREQLAAGAHRKPEAPEGRLPRQLDVGQREVAYHAVREAVAGLGKLSTALAGDGPVVTDAAFAAAVAEAVVPLEHAAREACRHD